MALGVLRNLDALQTARWRPTHKRHHTIKVARWRSCIHPANKWLGSAFRDPSGRCTIALAQSSAGLAHDRRLIGPSRRVERHVEAVPTVDRNNRKSKLCQFRLAEFLACHVVDRIRNLLVLK